MSLKRGVAMFACFTLTAGVAAIAAPGQGTARPGEPTQGRVLIENRAPNEAIPVNLEGQAGPLRVQMTGTPIVAIDAGSTVQARLVRQPWEYRTISVAAGQDAARLLASAGMEGWEATGVQIANQSAAILLLKRPR